MNRFCGPARRHFSDLMDGQPVPFGSGLLARIHLTICPQCKRVQRSLTGTQDALHALRDAGASEDPASTQRSREP